MKISLESLNSRYELEKGRISELEDRSVNIIQSEEQKGKSIKKNEQYLRDPRDTIKHTHAIHSHPEERKEKEEQEKGF